MTALTISTPYGSATVSLDHVDIAATTLELRAWANRPGHACPAARLARCRNVEAQFDRAGLLDLTINPPGDEVIPLSDEFNAWASDVFTIIRPLMPADHPCHAVQFLHLPEGKP